MEKFKAKDGRIRTKCKYFMWKEEAENDSKHYRIKKIPYGSIGYIFEIKGKGNLKRAFAIYPKSKINTQGVGLTLSGWNTTSWYYGMTKAEVREQITLESL